MLTGSDSAHLMVRFEWGRGRIHICCPVIQRGVKAYAKCRNRQYPIHSEIILAVPRTRSGWGRIRKLSCLPLQANYPARLPSVSVLPILKERTLVITGADIADTGARGKVPLMVDRAYRPEVSPLLVNHQRHSSPIGNPRPPSTRTDPHRPAS
jgi:hypothetical protein